MIFALLAFIVLGLVVAVVPGAILGCVCVVVSGRLPLGARVPLLLVLATGSAAMWLLVAETSHILRLVMVMLSFTATLVSGAASLAIQARRRRAPQFPTVVWPG